MIQCKGVVSGHLVNYLLIIRIPSSSVADNSFEFMSERLNIQPVNHEWKDILYAEIFSE
jgi:hypothetical protein